MEVKVKESEDCNILLYPISYPDAIFDTAHVTSYFSSVRMRSSARFALQVHPVCLTMATHMQWKEIYPPVERGRTDRWKMDHKKKK